MSFKFRICVVLFLIWFIASCVAQRQWDRRQTSPLPHHYHYDPHYNRDLYYGSHGAAFSYGKDRGYPDEWDPGDHRCRNVYTEKSPLTVTVETASTLFEGRYVYLCDGPDVNYRDRPQAIKEYPLLTKIDRNVTVFLGIPYARPPVDELRFKPPEYPQPIRRYRAWEYKASCPQLFNYETQEQGIVSIDEDCLYLNVFSPFVADSLKDKYPVMIYIHGGMWDSGTGNTFPAHILSSSQEVVVVTFNYRLGPLGFFSTADGASPGNYGLLDQDLVINWVYENINAFNGDPLSITLFGPGAGAASAGLHMLNYRTSKLVKRVIAQSGSAVADWAVISDPNFVRNNSVLFGIALGCDTRSSWNLVKCLRTRSIKELTSFELERKVGWITWAPVVDGYTVRREDQAVPDLPEIALERGYFKPDQDFAYMSGVTRDEAVSMLLRNKELMRNNYQVTGDYFRMEVKKYADKFNYTLYPEGLNNAIEFLYFPWSDPRNRTLLRQGYIDMLSDSYFKAPNDKMVKLMLLNNIKTYMYVVNYTAEGITKPEWQGVPHDSESLFISGAPFMDPGFYPRSLALERANWTEADRNMSIFFMEAFANFAKYGNPSPNRVLNTILWEPMQLNNFQYLSINTTNMTSVMLRDYRQKECHFWNFYIPKLIDKIPPTWPPTLEPLQDELRIYQSSLWGVTAAAGLFLLLTLLFCCLFCHAKSKSDNDSIRDPISSSTDLSLRTDYKTRYISDDSFAIRDSNRHTSV